MAICLASAYAFAQPPAPSTPEEKAASEARRATEAEEAKAREREKQEYNAAHPLYPNDLTNVGLERLEKRLGEAADKGDKDVTIEGLRILENYWNQAVSHHNVAAIGRIEADDFVCTDPSGAVTHKADDLEVAKSGALEITVSKLEDVTVNLLGDTAILTGKTSFAGRTPVIDLAVNGSYRWTDVFIRRDGRWQVVASQATNITPPQ